MRVFENGQCRDMKAEEIAEMESYQPSAAERIEELKNKLASTDYKAIKYAEGWLTEEAYAPVKAERQTIRDEINRLEQENTEE